MQSISHLDYNKKHIFPTGIRRGYKIGGAVTLFGLLCFSLFMLVAGIKQDTDKAPCFIVAGIFAITHIGCLVVWIKNYPIINAIYYIEDNIVFNCSAGMGIRSSIDLRFAIRNDYKHLFYVGKGHFGADYIIFSNYTLADSIASNFEGKSIYKTLEQIWASGAVIIPVENWK